MAQPPLNALRVFEAVARQGSFSRAADELRVTQSAVSHQVRHLEAWLGGPLFDREGNRPRLRPHGTDLSRALALALADIDVACRQARKVADPRTLTVAVIPSVAICWLIPRLADFRRRAPGADIRILYAIHGKDIDFRDVDVAVVFSDGTPELPGMAATRFLPGASAPVCSGGFAAAHQPLSTPEAIAGAELLHDTDQAGWQAWLAAAGSSRSVVPPGPVFEDFNLLRAAALAGQGIAICPLAIIHDDLAAGRLVQLSDRTILEGHAYFMVRKRAPETAYAGILLRFCDWLMSTVQ